jgi:hypothetical protein
LQRNIHIVYFFFANESKDWQRLVSEQLDDVEKSGILKTAFLHIVCCTSKEPTYKIEECIKKYSPCCSILFQENKYEYPALLHIKKLSKFFVDDIVVYLHSKGMVMHEYKERIPCNKTLTKTLFKDWEKTVTLLDTWSKVGLFPSKEGWVWFNFWWTNFSYIRTLKDFNIEKLVLDKNRHAAEHILGRYGSNTYTDSFSLYSFSSTSFEPSDACSLLGEIQIE